MSECGLALRQLGQNADSMEATSQKIVQYFYENFRDARTQQKSCAMVRLFKTHAYSELPAELQNCARQSLRQNVIPDSLKCLTLLATAGDQPEWNSRHASTGHKAIPLVNKTAIANIPMVSQLINQFGLDPGTLLQPDPEFMMDVEQKLYNVFHVAQALGSPYIPAQTEFVVPFKIKSVVGFGGLLPSGNMFALLMFLKTSVPRPTLDLIKPLALNVKMALLPFDQQTIFVDPKQSAQPVLQTSDLTPERLQSQVATLTQLLAVSEQSTQLQSDHLEEAITEVQLTLSQLRSTQVQMIHSEKMSALGQMVAGVAHEINNPINFIYGNLSYVNQYAKDFFRLLKLYQKHYPDPPAPIKAEIERIDLEFLLEDSAKIIKSIHLGTERIREIVRSLRHFSRLDEAEVKDVEIHQGIDSTLTILHSRLRACPEHPEIRVIKDYGPLPLVECYAGQLNQVLMNIISNAIDAFQEKDRHRTPQDIVANPNEIRIRTHVTRPNWIAIRIADNGSGMSESTLTKLFDPFFTTKAVGQGTGLGLSISYQIIVEKHGGNLYCHSEPGKGSEFVIEIPIRQSLPKANVLSQKAMSSGMSTIK